MPGGKQAAPQADQPGRPAIAPADITAVKTAEELQAALVYGAQDIEIQGHIDLDDAPAVPIPQGREGMFDGLGNSPRMVFAIVSEQTRSIRVRIVPLDLPIPNQASLSLLFQEHIQYPCLCVCCLAWLYVADAMPCSNFETGQFISGSSAISIPQISCWPVIGTVRCIKSVQILIKWQ